MLLYDMERLFKKNITLRMPTGLNNLFHEMRKSSNTAGNILMIDILASIRASSRFDIIEFEMFSGNLNVPDSVMKRPSNNAL